MKNRVLKTTICVIMVVAVLCFSFSVYADNEVVIPTDNPYTIINETEDYYWRLWIWGALKSFGINISIGDVVEYTDALDDYMERLILSYLETIPSISNWNQWILPWVGGINSSGFFEGNASFVEDVNDFAQWMIDTFGIDDNEDVVLQRYNYIVMDGEEYPIYIAPHYIVPGSTGNTNIVYDNWYPNFTIGASTTDVLEDLKGFEINHTYQLESGAYFRIDTSEMKAILANDINLNNRIQSFGWNTSQFFECYGYDRDDNHQYPWAQNDGTWYGYNGHNQVYWMMKSPNALYQTKYNYCIVVDVLWKDNAGASVWNDKSMFTPHFSDANMEEYFLPHPVTGNANTAIINIPSDDGNYQTGDSIVIIDGEPNYLVIEFPDSVSVDNLPASIIPNNLTNPELEEVYRPIRSFINVAQDGMESIIGLINELPEQALVCIYAVIGGVIIFGIIKLFREH